MCGLDKTYLFWSRFCQFHSSESKTSTATIFEETVLTTVHCFILVFSHLSFLIRTYSSTETEGQLLNSFVQYFGDSLGRKIKRMPLIEETVLPGDSLLTLPVVIIGEFFHFFKDSLSVSLPL